MAAKRTISFFRLAALAATLTSAARGQAVESGSGWQSPFTFDVTNAGGRWALTGSVKGRAISDGKTVEISVERCEIYRSRTFAQPQEVRRITAGIIRHGDNDFSRWVLFGDSHPVNQTLTPDQTLKVEPFQLRIHLADYPLLKGDTLAFNLVMPTGTVPIHVTNPLPVAQVAAYCADTMEQFKKPGNPIVQAYRVCHDSAGRVRRERWYYPSASPPKSAATLVSIEILDPVANLIDDLDPRTKKAVRRKGFTSAAGFGIPIGGIIGGIPSNSPALKPVESNKYLGTKQINGVDADGKLYTTVYPAGYQGRAEEITTTEETWYSFQIQAAVRRVRMDPRNGDYEYQVTSIKLGDPDTSLFRVPDDYEVAGSK